MDAVDAIERRRPAPGDRPLEPPVDRVDRAGTETHDRTCTSSAGDIRQRRGGRDDRGREPGHRRGDHDGPGARRGGARAAGRRAREAQPQWAALGFDGRARVMRRAQKWMLDNAERVIDTVVAETGKTYEDAQLADLGYTVGRARVLGQAGGAVPRRRAGAVVEQPAGGRQEARRALRAAWAGRRDRPLELPDRQRVRRLHPGADGRQRGDPQASGGDAAELAADGRDDARVRPARGRLPGRDRRRRDRRGADRVRSTA